MMFFARRRGKHRATLGANRGDNHEAAIAARSVRRTDLLEFADHARPRRIEQARRIFRENAIEVFKFDRALIDQPV